MSTEIQKLQARLLDAGVTNFNVFPGANPNVTSEEVAAEINKALDAIEAGDYEVVAD